MMASGACTADYRSPSPVRSSRVTPVSRITGGLQSDAAAGVLLLTAAAVALIWANSPFGASYEAVRSLRLGPGGLRLDLTVREWAADGLLAAFFFTIGSGARDGGPQLTWGDVAAIGYRPDHPQPAPPAADGGRRMTVTALRPPAARPPCPRHRAR
jgi:hypothetical protein